VRTLKLPEVSSSAVKRVDYDEESRELFVTFTDGDVYAYLNVPLAVYGELLDAPSVGAYVNQRVKPYYEMRPVARRGSLRKAPRKQS
jgi:hypothetical protein